jgi:hypothetical protein
MQAARAFRRFDGIADGARSRLQFWPLCATLAQEPRVGWDVHIDKETGETRANLHEV